MYEREFETRVLAIADKLKIFTQSSKNFSFEEHEHQLQVISNFQKTLRDMVTDCEHLKTLLINEEKSGRKEGEIWCEDGAWFAMSPEGECGPWNNQPAAEAASRGFFKTAQKLNHAAIERRSS